MVRRPGRPPLLMVGDLTYDADLLAAGTVPGVGNKRQLRQAVAAVNELRLRTPGLTVLFDRPAQSQADLTRWLGVEPPTTAKMLARMEKAGFVERARSETDRRVILVSLTRAGRALYKRVSTVWDDLEHVTTAGLAESEVRELERLLRQVISNLLDDQETPAGC